MRIISMASKKKPKSPKLKTPKKELILQAVIAYCFFRGAELLSQAILGAAGKRRRRKIK